MNHYSLTKSNLNDKKSSNNDFIVLLVIALIGVLGLFYAFRGTNEINTNNIQQSKIFIGKTNESIQVKHFF